MSDDFDKETQSEKIGFPRSKSADIQLNIIARAILIHKDLINIWKEIGYYDIVNEVNNLVIQGALLLLFPQIPPKDYVMLTVKEIINNLQELIDLGFNPTDTVILDILQLNIGERIIQAFISVCKNEKRDEFFKKIVGEAIKSERNIKKVEVLNFLDQIMGNKTSHLEFLKKVSHEDILYPLFEYYLLDLFELSPTFNMPMQITDNSNVYFKSKRKRKKRTMIREQRVEWLIAIENIYNDIRKGNSNALTMSTKFKNCVEILYYKLRDEGIFEELEIELEMELEMNPNIKKYKVFSGITVLMDVT
ncbi:hypothetical protein C2G38_2249947 [Gigaspora rosea]|uniref:Uncharacterized protein n=1 Tax=Gigaspora rosea TaxID=44941 RepID=A0A397UNG3_9GLOM|nr:hypothetical protein C2G38_2249947 [Gigaspora rosea]